MLLLKRINFLAAQTTHIAVHYSTSSPTILRSRAKSWPLRAAMEV